jgi:hypothetical protein
MKKFLSELVKDDNNINEKSVIGIISFSMLVLTLLIDLITGLANVEFPIHEFVFDGFVLITIGSFGIASIDKFVNKKSQKEDSGQM